MNVEDFPKPAPRGIVISRPGEGHQATSVDGRKAVVRVPARQTNGVLELTEMDDEPCDEVPIHSHNQPLGWLILEGSYLFFVQDQWHRADAGAFVWVPGSVPFGLAAIEGARSRKLNFVLEGSAQSGSTCGRPEASAARQIGTVQVPTTMPLEAGESTN